MPFRGKPSQGCEECRKRRKKCDLRAGGCGRCANAHRPCPGYPQQDSLRILDQSAEIVSKARSTRSKGSTPETDSPLGSDRSSSAALSSPAVSTYVSPLPVDSEDLSFAFFFNNCIINSNVYHNCVHEPNNKHLVAGIKAFGIANLSKHYSDKRLLISAQHQYATALNLTNLALRDPVQVKRDETLLAILILTNYETLTGGVTRTLDAWEQHVNGASSLLNLRGLDGVQGTAGRVITLHVITSINVICLLRCLSTPPFIHLLQAKIFEYLYEPGNPAVRYQRISLECADFRHAVTHCQITSPDEIISRAAELDAKLIEAFTNVPKSWEGEFIRHFAPRTSVEAGLPSFEIRYADQATNYIWASVRSSRIMVNEVVFQSISNDTDVHQLVRDRSKAIMRQCQTEILAGMAQYTSGDEEMLPWSGFKRPVRYFVPEAVSSDLPIMRALSGYGVLWPLFVAGTCSTSTRETKAHVAEIYGYFGDQLKIEQALLLRKMIWALLRVSASPNSRNVSAI
ncbi:hypothetical protein KCU95_g4662, partial [Aureobasidium melanogenum]